MTAKGAEEPPKEVGTIPGTNAHLVEVGQKAEYVVVVGLYKNGNPPFRYQRVPLDHRFPDAPEIQQMQVAYQKELEQMRLGGVGAEAGAALDRPQVCREQDVRVVSYEGGGRV